MKDNRIKLIVCDIDDTLIHKEQHLKSGTQRLIQTIRDQGVQFSLATGRMPYRSDTFAKEAGLTIPYIANNGSILYNGGKIVFCKRLKAKQVKSVVQKYMKADPEFTVIFSYFDRECPLVRTQWIRSRLHKYKGYDEALGNTDEAWNQEVHKVYVLDDARTGIIGKAAEELMGLGGDFNLYQYGEYSIEIVAGGCSKASGLIKLLKYLDILPEQVMAIGDHTNDIEIVGMAGIGVAVANADPKLKQAADYVTSLEREAGVEEAVKRFVLNQRR